MPRIMIRLVSVLLSLWLCLSMVVPSAIAQTDEQNLASRKFDAVILFFSSAVDGNNYFAPFDDFFSQNQCKRRDINALSKKRDETGLLIRKSLLDSKVSYNDTLKLLNRYELLSAEIYYVRNLDLLNDNQAELLNSETRALYPDNTTLRDIVLQWEQKYTRKLAEYKDCHTSWSDIGKEWDQFITDAGKAIDEFKKASSAAWKTLKETPEGIVDNTKKTVSGFYNTILEIPDLFGDDRKDEIANNNVKLGLKYQNTGPSAFEDRIKRSPFGLGDSRAAQYLARNPNASLGDLVDQAVNYDSNTTEVYEAYLEEESLKDLAANLDGTFIGTWNEASKTPQEMSELNKLVNPDYEAAATVSGTLDLILENQCRYGV